MKRLERSRRLVTWLVLTFVSSPALAVHAKGEVARVTAEQVNQAVAAVQKLSADEIQKGSVPGLAIAVVFADQVVFTGGFGVRNVNTREPVNADTVFQLASLSKPVGSTVVAELIGEGKISWDSKISDLDPDFQMYDPWVTREITLRDFYAHRSGLPEHSGDLLEDLVGSSRVDLQACKLEYSIVSPK